MPSAGRPTRILFLASHRPDRSPGQRFRFEQYLGHLRASGFDVEFSYFLGPDEDRALYGKGEALRKLGVLLKAWRVRRDDQRTFKDRDIVFIQREAWMLGSTCFERAVKSSGAKLVFDFDDSVWLLDVSEANRRWRWLKNPAKTSEIIGLADMVFAGNSYLADYAHRFNSNVRIVPTTIDTAVYTPRTAPKPADAPVVIGWSGSVTTIKHFNYARRALQAIKERYGDRVRFHVIGDASFECGELEIRGQAWSMQSELDDLRAFDIGIMPLPDDEWAKGKCGLKGLQYMALAVPTVMSPVGVNSEIIAHGENGFLARGEDEWVLALSKLLDSPELRHRLGAAARRTVESRFSVESQKGNYVRYLTEVLGNP